ncbi:MAG: acetate--CoA ligase, partial [Bacteroidales bacterium]|nr:acetate--CoA ligase [Bacteroidales bacterium]
GITTKISYKELHANVCKVANVLKLLGVKKGDIVTIYLPMAPELIYSMLACARIGAIHSVVFSGFSANALSDRLAQSKSNIVITRSISNRGGRSIDLKKNVKNALKENKTFVKKVLLMDDDSSNNNSSINFADDNTTDSVMVDVSSFNIDSNDCYCEAMSATDPVFILYTSGSTGRPKGVIHSSGGYLTYVNTTFESIFDIGPNDVYFCTADIGWITGHSYGVYGPLSNGATLVLFQGIPTYPDASRYWKIIDEHRVSLFYTAPTALRSLMKMDEMFVKNASLKSLRILASVGEPIDPSTWQWYYDVVGHKRCPIIDTWWQTETGGIMICPFLQKVGQKPGCASKPFVSIEPEIMINEDGQGVLGFKKSWPGQFIGILNDLACFQSYFCNGTYISKDGAKFDKDGDIWILGRVDDVLNVSGHRLNSSELENAVMSHPSVVDSGVVGFPHEIKGQGIIVFVVIKDGDYNHELLSKEIKEKTRDIIGPIATPDKIVFVSELPKTRSGKIVRYLLQKIASKKDIFDDDKQTLINAKCIEDISERLRCS